MSKTLRWSVSAADDLAGIVETIAGDSPKAADRLEAKILRRVELLGAMPYLGSISPFSRNVRFLVHGSYVIYYTVHRTEVVIRAVVHGARLFQSRWIRRDE